MDLLVAEDWVIYFYANFSIEEEDEKRPHSILIEVACGSAKAILWKDAIVDCICDSLFECVVDRQKAHAILGNFDDVKDGDFFSSSPHYHNQTT